MTLNLRTRMFACASLLLAFCPGIEAKAESPRVNNGDTELLPSMVLPRMDLIEPGVSHYLRYKVEGGRSAPIDIISVEVKREPGEQWAVHQHWIPSDLSLSEKTLESTFAADSFQPLTHIRRTTKAQETTVEAFAFHGRRIRGMVGLSDNTQVNYDVVGAEASFNFEVDLLLMQALPWTKDYTARLAFHHPGGPPPAVYEFTASGEEALLGPDGKLLDCWLVTSTYNVADQPVARFWIAKDTQRVVKMVASMDGKTAIVKTLLW